MARWVHGAVAYCHFIHLRHPKLVPVAEVDAFLLHLVRDTNTPLPGQADARRGLWFLDQEFLPQAHVLPSDAPALPTPTSGSQGIPRLRDQIRAVMGVRRYARPTEKCYVNGTRRSILFHDQQHPCTGCDSGGASAHGR